MERRHSRHADTVRYFPVGLSRRVIGDHVLGIEKLRRLRIHALRYRCAVLTGNSVADGAMLAIEMRACHEIISRGLNRSFARIFLVHASMQSHPGELLLKWHRRRSGRNRGISKTEVAVDA